MLLLWVGVSFFLDILVLFVVAEVSVPVPHEPPLGRGAHCSKGA
jgi:hypothetical protein